MSSTNWSVQTVTVLFSRGDRGPRRTLYPQDWDVVALELPIVGHHREPFDTGLGNQHPVERVGVVKEQIRQLVGVAEG